MKKLSLVFLLVGLVSLSPLVAQTKLKSGNGYLFARVQSTSTGWSLALWNMAHIHSFFGVHSKLIWRVPTEQIIVIYELPEGEYSFLHSVYLRYLDSHILQAPTVRVTAGEIVYAGDIFLEPVYNSITEPDLNYRVKDNFEEAVSAFNQEKTVLASKYPIRNALANTEELSRCGLSFSTPLAPKLYTIGMFLDSPAMSKIIKPVVVLPRSGPVFPCPGPYRLSFDAGELSQALLVPDSSLRFPMEFQYHFAEIYALMGGIRVQPRQHQLPNISMSLGSRVYLWPTEERYRVGIFLGLYPLWNISPSDCVESGRFVWNAELEIGSTWVITKHLFMDAGLGWTFHDIPYNEWYLSSLLFSFKLGFAF